MLRCTLVLEPLLVLHALVPYNLHALDARCALVLEQLLVLQALVLYKYRTNILCYLPPAYPPTCLCSVRF